MAPKKLANAERWKNAETPVRESTGPHGLPRLSGMISYTCGGVVQGVRRVADLLEERERLNEG